MKKRYKPILYIEGVQVPVVAFSVSSQPNSPLKIDIEIPALKQFETFYKITPITEEEDSEEDTQVENESDLEVVCSVEASGIQPFSRVQIFLQEKQDETEILFAEGFIIGTAFSKTSDNITGMKISALGDLNYLQECQMYMVDLSRSLGITSGFESSRGAVASADSIVNKLTDKGLVDGLYELLKEAGTGANDYLNLLWRLYRYAQKFSIVNNPKALGYFTKTRLKSILNKQLSNIPNKQPVISMIMAVLQMVRYQTVEVIAPSFINVNYPATKDVSSLDTLDHEGDIKMNKIIVMPKISFSPPPRCNVLFPCDYDSIMYSQAFAQDPTRGYTRLSKTATLRGTEGDNKLIIIPDDVKEGVRAHGQYWSSFEEKYRGQRMCAFNYERPDYLEDFGSDYIKEFMNIEYATYKYRGNQLQVTCSFNFKPIPGFPILILQKDGNHKMAYLESIGHSYKAGNPFATQMNFSLARPYDAPVPDADTLWFEQAMFSQENIGYHVYPDLIGQKYCFTLFDKDNTYEEDRYITAAQAREHGYYVDSTIDGEEIVDTSELQTVEERINELTPDVEPLEVEEEDEAEINRDEDMSILKILSQPNMTVDQIKEAKQSAKAIKNAADAIFAEYNNSGNKEKYAYNFGRRLPIGINQCMEMFYKAQGSTDKFTYTGGYTLVTNSINVVNPPVDEDSEETRDEIVNEIGVPIPDDADIGGCYYKEKQFAIVTAVNALWSMVLNGIADNAYTDLEDDINLISPLAVENSTPILPEPLGPPV